jgi:hypothetical protein
MLTGIWLPPVSLHAQTAPPNLPASRQTLRSLHGHFLINAPALNLTRLTNALVSLKTNEVWLHGPVLAVSAERVRAALYGELRTEGLARQPIHLVLHPQTNPPVPLLIQSIRQADGWRQRVDLPERVDREHFIKALAGACLLELASRDPRKGRPELPLWLTEGLGRHLHASALAPLVVQTELLPQAVPDALLESGAVGARFFASQRMPDPYRFARPQLAARGPLDFAALGRPGALVTEADREHFRSCAQVFVGELLKLPDGPAALLEFTRRLPDYLNWELAFLEAFRAHFRSALDVEKWWSVTLVALQGRDQHAKLSAAEGLRQLAAVLTVPVNVRQQAGRLPDAGVTPVQQFIAEANLEDQRAVLSQMLQQLRLLQWNVTPDLLKLIEDYRATLENYYNRRFKPAAGVKGRSITAPPALPALVRETVVKLNLLDLLQADFARFAAEPAVVNTSATGR